jgi:hypothetical protein
MGKFLLSTHEMNLPAASYGASNPKGKVLMANRHLSQQAAGNSTQRD